MELFFNDPTPLAFGLRDIVLNSFSMNRTKTPAGFGVRQVLWRFGAASVKKRQRAAAVHDASAVGKSGVVAAAVHRERERKTEIVKSLNR